jgi:hypothetical protein
VEAVSLYRFRRDGIASNSYCKLAARLAWQVWLHKPALLIILASGRSTMMLGFVLSSAHCLTLSRTFGESLKMEKVKSAFRPS